MVRKINISSSFYGNKLYNFSKCITFFSLFQLLNNWVFHSHNVLNHYLHVSKLNA